MSSMLALELESALRSSLMSAGNRSACIRAVNSHEELVANLQMLLGYETMKEFWDNNQGFRRAVEKSIAKAEGKA